MLKNKKQIPQLLENAVITRSEISSEFQKAIDIANELENDLRNCELEIDYKVILKISLFTARKIKAEIPMYTGNLNPKWALYDDVVSVIVGRLNE
jgi:hypothetical protein